MAGEASLGVADYLSAISRRRKLGFAIGVPIAVAALVVAVALPSRYRSQAMFEMEEAKLAAYMPNQGNSGRVNMLDQYVGSLAETVLSESNLTQAVEATHPFASSSKSTPVEVAQLRQHTDVKMVKRKILDPFSGRDREIISGFTVGFDHPDPATAQRVAVWLADAFAKANREKFRQGAESAAAFFAAEADRLRRVIEADEKRLADFKAKNVGRLPDQTDMNLELMDRSQRDLENVQMQLRSLQRDRVFLVQQLAQAQVSPQADNVRELEAEYARRLTMYDESHPDLVSLRRQIESLRSGGPVDNLTLQAQLDAQKAVLAGARQRYSDDHPDVKRIQRNIESLEARIASGEGRNAAPQTRRTPVTVQLQTQINATDTQIAGLEAQAASLRAKLASFETRIESSPEVEREYQEINRDLAGAREKYQQLVSQQRDAELSESAIAGGRGDEFRMVQSPALPESPASPRRVAIIVLGIIAALLVGIVSIFAAESLDSTVRGKHDVRRVMDLNPLATIPDIRTNDTIALERGRLIRFAGAVSIAAVGLFAAIRFVF